MNSVAKSPPTIAIEATWLDDDGRGVGRADDREIHVADLLPGELAEVRIDHYSPHRAVAWATRVGPRARLSPHRVEPPCPAFGACGGCAWQHCSGREQRRAKAQRVERALAAHLESPPPVAPVRAAPQQLRYRGRAKYVVTHDGRGAITLGAFQPRSHKVVDTRECVVVEERISASLPPLRRALEATGLASYDEATATGSLRYAVVRTSLADAVTIALVTTPATPREPLARAARALVRNGHAEGVVWVRNPSRGGAILTGEVECLAGSPLLRERFGAVVVDLDIASFTQVNRAAAAAMYEALCDSVEGARRAVDLYCGAGAIAFHLVQRGIAVLGIERHAPAITAARAAARDAGIHARFEASDAEAAQLAEFRPDLVVVNPPRKGLSLAVVDALVRAAPQTIAYLSCAPTSLARDLARLDAAGYVIQTVQPFDLMPGTSQVETLCICRRQVADASSVTRQVTGASRG